MLEILLLLHIIVACSSLVFASYSALQVYKEKIRSAKNSILYSWIGTLLTVISGISVTLISGASFGKMCVSLLTFLAVIVFAQAYYSVKSKFVFEKGNLSQ